MAWKCQDCRFFEPESGAVKAEMAGSGAMAFYGDCRRHPPIVLPGRQIGQGAAAISHPIDRWPHVHRDQWCGDYAERDPSHLGGH